MSEGAVQKWEHPEEGGELQAYQRAGVLPSASPDQVVDAFSRYKQIQAALDREMPECLMEIRGKQFRKKSYWRAIATAFDLSVELLREEQVEQGDDWGWLVTYRARAANGRHSDGDGSCFASEKGPNQASIHNVRAHAHTRAKNRAISDLVGFGEVSAEEMPPEGADPRPAPPRKPQRSQGGGGTGPITEKQQKRLWAIAGERANKLDMDRKEIAESVYARFGIESTKQITRDQYDAVVEAIERWVPDDAGDAPPDETPF